MGGVRGSGWGSGLGGQGGCERRIEVFVKIQKKKIFWRGGGLGRGSGWGFRVEVNDELNFLGKFTQKNAGGGREGVSGWWGVRVDVNAMFGVGVMWGMGDVNQ